LLIPGPRAQLLARTLPAGAAIGYAPGRANLIGEHLDYNGGHSLPIALPYWTFAVALPDQSPGLRIVSHAVGEYVDHAPTNTQRTPRRDWTDYVIGVLDQLRDHAGLPPGLTLKITSSVPRGAGLSSSASLTVATAHALMRLASPDADPERSTLSRLSQRSENDFVGAPTGGLDQAALLGAQAGRALLVEFPSGQERSLLWHPSSAGLRLLVVDTGIRHAHDAGEYGARVAECRQAAALLGVRHLADADDLDPLTDPVLVRRARHVMSEESRVHAVVGALESGDYSAVGAAMFASHVSLRDDYEVSCPELDRVVDTARAVGAIGARLTGGGFGGCALVMIDDALVDEFSGSITAACLAAGAPTPVLYDGTAVAGAGSLSARGT
jgi:galactokinase